MPPLPREYRLQFPGATQQLLSDAQRDHRCCDGAPRRYARSKRVCCSSGDALGSAGPSSRNAATRGARFIAARRPTNAARQPRRTAANPRTCVPPRAARSARAGTTSAAARSAAAPMSTALLKRPASVAGKTRNSAGANVAVRSSSALGASVRCPLDVPSAAGSACAKNRSLESGRGQQRKGIVRVLHQGKDQLRRRQVLRQPNCCAGKCCRDESGLRVGRGPERQVCCPNARVATGRQTGCCPIGTIADGAQCCPRKVPDCCGDDLAPLCRKGQLCVKAFVSP